MRREKKDQLLITFPTTAASIALESYCRENGIPGRLIPVPGEIAAGCGMAWKTEPAQEEQMRRVFAETGLLFQDFHRIML